MTTESACTNDHIDDCPNCEAPAGKCCDDWCRWCRQLLPIKPGPIGGDA